MIKAVVCSRTCLAVGSETVFISHPPSRLSPPHILRDFPCRYWALKILASSPSLAASYASSVRQASALPAASAGFHLALDTLAVRLTIPPAGFVEDFHLQVKAPCRAHKSKSLRIHTQALEGPRLESSQATSKEKGLAIVCFPNRFSKPTESVSEIFSRCKISSTSSCSVLGIRAAKNCQRSLFS